MSASTVMATAARVLAQNFGDAAGGSRHRGGALRLAHPAAAARVPAYVIVAAWLDRQPTDAVWITSITVYEVRLGLALLTKGRRRKALEAAFARLLRKDLEGRVLDFDSAAAEEAAALAAGRQKAGRSVDVRDTQIAGIALARRATVATRNVRHFLGLSVNIVNPSEGVEGAR